MNLAKSLAEAGRHAESIEQAQICLELSPGMEAAKVLIARLRTTYDPAHELRDVGDG